MSASAVPFGQRSRSEDPREYWDGVLDDFQSDWIYTFAQIHDESPSRRISDAAKRLGFSEECQKRAKGILYLYACCRQLKLSRSVALTASYYFHRFYMRRDFVTFHYFEIAATSLFIACKADECRRRLADLVKVCAGMALQGRVTSEIDENSKVYWRWKDVITNLEELMLEVLCFDMNPDNPYKLCMEALQVDFEEQTGSDENRQIFMECTGLFEQISRLPVCLLFDSQTICALAVGMASKTGKPGFLEALGTDTDKVWRCYKAAIDLAARLTPLRPELQVKLPPLTRDKLAQTFATIDTSLE